MTVLRWRERFESDDGLELRQPATDEALSTAEVALKARFPAELRELYRVSDGVFDRPGQWLVVWPLAHVVDRNQFDWSEADARDADRLTFVGFGDDGTGTAFCVPRDGGNGVFVWAPLDHEAIRLADSVTEFWARWQANSLPQY